MRRALFYRKSVASAVRYRSGAVGFCAQARVVSASASASASTWTRARTLAHKRTALAGKMALKREKSAYGETPYLAAVTTYLGYAVLICFGHLRDALDGIAGLLSLRRWRRAARSARDALPPLLNDFEDFYTRRLYDRINDCWGRPITGTAGAWIDLLERKADYEHASLRASLDAPKGAGIAAKVPQGDASYLVDVDTQRASTPRSLTGRLRRCLNLGSYNYLGYADVPGGVHRSVRRGLDNCGIASCDTATGTGRTNLVRRLERTVADFIGKEDSIVVGMGFATNSMVIPAIVGRGDLIISDALNHASIVVGARSSGAKIRVFEHNDPRSLEATVRDAIETGAPGGKPWERILIVIEGMYSMEGETPLLRDIVAVKKKYGCYLYLDEAHSIGALGPTGRGCCEHHGVDPADVDIMMGTFTKSFGAVGGYVAGSRVLMDTLRVRSAAMLYASAMAPACASHIIWAFEQLRGRDGTGIGAAKIRALRENSIYFRNELARRGLQTLGDWDSPVVPIMLYNPAKIAAFSRECLARGLALVVVGFPATPLLLSRARICLSAAHTRADLDWALEVIDDVAETIEIKYNRSWVERFCPAALADALLYTSESFSKSSSPFNLMRVAS